MSADAPNDPFAHLGPASCRSRSEQDEAVDDWQLLPVPADDAEAPCTFRTLGSWSMRFAYHQASGAFDGYVLRFDTASGKTFRPCRYGRLRGRIGWHLRGWPGDNRRPLYRLPELVAAPSAPVLLCEGEKSADAAARLLGPSWAVIASMNGSESPKCTDWSPLAGRDLVIWPDNDAAGRAYARTVAALVLAAGARRVRIVDLPATLEEGWDLADPIPDGVQLDPVELLRMAPEFEPGGSEEPGRIKTTAVSAAASKNCRDVAKPAPDGEQMDLVDYIADAQKEAPEGNIGPGHADAMADSALAKEDGASCVRSVDVAEPLPESLDRASRAPDRVQINPEDLLAPALNADPDYEEQGGFRVQRRQAGGFAPGLYYKTVEKGSDTKEERPTWRWFASPVEVLADTRDGDGREWGRYLAVHDRDGQVHHITMAMAATAGDGAEYRRELLRHGLVLAPGKAARERLEVFLVMWRPKRRVRCVARIGWHGPRFVLPDRTFGPGDETVVLQAERPTKFMVAGSLAEWQELVARPAVGNSRLAFAISASFVGPLLEPLGQESGGFHFRGGSSIGKTSILHAARSSWGCPLGSWRTTDNAAEGTAAGACDTLYLLDEVSQADGRAVDAMAYMLGNGTGKSRAGRNGAARQPVTWRNLFLSTGELSLADKIAEAGKRARAGQSVRVIDIPADAGKGLGVFDTLHGFTSGAALADQLRHAGEAHSGHAARAFLEQITGDLPATVEALRTYMAKWLTANTPRGSDGQVGRVAARFALVAAAGELATALGILPWPVGEASDAAARCFHDWLAARGDTGPEEIAAGLRQVRAFLEMHGASRFEEAWPGNSSARTINRAGFRRLEHDGQGQNWEYFVLPEAWRAELCKGLDATTTARAMIARGWMTAGEGKHLTRSIRVPGVGKTRLYCITSGFLAGDDA